MRLGWLRLKARTLAWLRNFETRHGAFFYAFTLGFIPTLLALISDSRIIIVTGFFSVAAIAALPEIINFKSARNFIIGLAVLPGTGDEAVLSPLKATCLNKGIAVTDADIYRIQGGRLSENPMEWGWKVAQFEQTLGQIGATDANKVKKKAVHIGLASTASLAFACGVGSRRAQNLYIYDYHTDLDGSPYTLAALWHGRSGEGVTGQDAPAVATAESMLEVDVTKTSGDKTVVALELTGHASQGDLAELQQRLGCGLVKIKLNQEHEGLAEEPALMWLFAQRAFNEITILQEHGLKLHLCLSVHNVVAFLLGCMVGNYQANISVYHPYNSTGGSKIYERVIDTADIP